MNNTGLRNAPRSTSFNQKRKDVQTHYEVKFNIANITLNLCEIFCVQFDSAHFKDQAAFQQASFCYVSQLQDVNAAKQ